MGFSLAHIAATGNLAKGRQKAQSAGAVDHTAARIAAKRLAGHHEQEAAITFTGAVWDDESAQRRDALIFDILSGKFKGRGAGRMSWGQLHAPVDTMEAELDALVSEQSQPRQAQLPARGYSLGMGGRDSAVHRAEKSAALAR